MASVTEAETYGVVGELSKQFGKHVVVEGQNSSFAGICLWATCTCITTNTVTQYTHTYSAC